MNSIGGFLGNDSTFGKLMTKVGTIIAANIMFAVCCIPFVTVGAAQKALYHTVFSLLNTEDAINPFRTFWQGFRKNFIRTTLYWIGFCWYNDTGLCGSAGMPTGGGRNTIFFCWNHSGDAHCDGHRGIFISAFIRIHR